jgi:hypothetical protein
MPKEPGRLLERRVRSQVADRKAGDDQLAPLAIHFTKPRRRGNYALKTLSRHSVNLEDRLSRDKLTIREETAMIATRSAVSDIRNSDRPAARSRSAQSPWQVVFISQFSCS